MSSHGLNSHASNAQMSGYARLYKTGSKQCWILRPAHCNVTGNFEAWQGNLTALPSLDTGWDFMDD